MIGSARKIKLAHSKEKCCLGEGNLDLSLQSIHLLYNETVVRPVRFILSFAEREYVCVGWGVYTAIYVLF